MMAKAKAAAEEKAWLKTRHAVYVSECVSEHSSEAPLPLLLHLYFFLFLASLPLLTVASGDSM